MCRLAESRRTAGGKRPLSFWPPSCNIRWRGLPDHSIPHSIMQAAENGRFTIESVTAQCVLIAAAFRGSVVCWCRERRSCRNVASRQNGLQVHLHLLVSRPSHDEVQRPVGCAKTSRWRRKTPCASLSAVVNRAASTRTVNDAPVRGAASQGRVVVPFQVNNVRHSVRSQR